MCAFPVVWRRSLESVTAERDLAFAQLKVARATNDITFAERDSARKERDLALKAIAYNARESAERQLTPIAICRNRAEWEQFLASDTFKSIMQAENEISFDHRQHEEWSVAGFSLPAQEAVFFKVDMHWGGQCIVGENYPNLRERLVCPVTNLNNRQRLMAALVHQKLSHNYKVPPVVHFMEQSTELFSWVAQTFQNIALLGSEFLGDSFRPGEIVDGIRHENALNLSFEDSSRDFIVSNDVMEHVPTPLIAFRELARVLRPGGQALMTFPFFSSRDHSMVRAELIDGVINHLCTPEYHGNPFRSGGSLVFVDFGWDILDTAREVGFRDVVLEFYHSILYGHLGWGIVFRLIR